MYIKNSPPPPFSFTAIKVELVGLASVRWKSKHDEDLDCEEFSEKFLSKKVTVSEKCMNYLLQYYFYFYSILFYFFFQAAAVLWTTL